ncbi:hypothetical protein [Dysgonomonas sp. 511]|uniref:hypothetical protein n=1 Tax=Dysgonomonas sp. 511 TaxID=2302930 RepID=UPI0013D8D25B|nr:hypothetical protein [Dysgonomonas sp. 511]NDV79145.1 hypothetical protein [Dysgonomonas sp. 511]
MKKLVSLSLFFFISYLAVYATIQIPDKLIYNGKEYNPGNFYLEDFFIKNPDKKPDFQLTSTALWRGYIATFEIEDDQLFLTNVETISYNETDSTYHINYTSVLHTIFPDSKRVKADWFTGIFWGGKNKEKSPMPFEYDEYCMFEIKDGNIVKEKNLKRSEFKNFKKQQLKAFKQTDKYQQCIEQLKEDYSKQVEVQKQMMESMGNTEYREESSTSLGKRAKRFIDYNIFNFIPEFIE